VAVTELQLNRAKEATKSAVLMNLESRVLSSSIYIYIYIYIISVGDLCYVLAFCLHYSCGSLMFWFLLCVDCVVWCLFVFHGLIIVVLCR
jgi:hypothetical protein